MITNLEFSENNVSWTYESGKKLVNVEGISSVYDEKIEKKIIVRIRSEKKSIEQYIYDYSGNLSMYFNTKENIVFWNYNNKKETLSIKNLLNVGFFPKYKLIFLVYLSNTTEKIDVLNFEGEYLYELFIPQGYQFYYFQENENNLFAVCTADKMHQDEFGRSDFNFKIDLETGYLIKEGLAY